MPGLLEEVAPLVNEAHLFTFTQTINMANHCIVLLMSLAIDNPWGMFALPESCLCIRHPDLLFTLDTFFETRVFPGAHAYHTSLLQTLQ